MTESARRPPWATAALAAFAVLGTVALVVVAVAMAALGAWFFGAQPLH